MFSSFSCMYVFENNSGSKFTKSLHKTWWCRWILNLIKNTSVYEFNTQINFLRKIHAIRSQNIKAKATQRNTRCKNCSSSYWADPGAGPVAPNPWSPQLKLVAKNPNGNAPKRKRTISYWTSRKMWKICGLMRMRVLLLSFEKNFVKATYSRF